jgi:hypothetical protein
VGNNYDIILIGLVAVFLILRLRSVLGKRTGNERPPPTRDPFSPQAEALRRRGVDVLLVTSDQHPESDAARDYELVLDPRFRRAATWPATLAAWRRVREYRPDVVIAELVADPRWIALAGSAPRVQLVHDDRPHDPRPPDRSLSSVLCSASSF